MLPGVMERYEERKEASLALRSSPSGAGALMPMKLKVLCKHLGSGFLFLDFEINI